MATVIRVVARSAAEQDNNQRKSGAASWRRSWDGSLIFFRSWAYLLLCLPVRTDRLHWAIHHVGKRNWERRWGTADLDRFYDVYQGYVLREAERRGREVLVRNADDGWEPLCRFLGKDAPKDEPFPWLNDTATMTFLKRVLVARGILMWMVVLGSAYAAWRYGAIVLLMATSGIGRLLRIS